MNLRRVKPNSRNDRYGDYSIYDSPQLASTVSGHPPSSVGYTEQYAPQQTQDFYPPQQPPAPAQDFQQRPTSGGFLNPNLQQSFYQNNPTIPNNSFNQKHGHGFNSEGQQAFTLLQPGNLAQSVAMQYGQTFVGQSQEMVSQNLEKYMDKSKIKYYFAVDTNYVTKKLGLLFFPYMHKDWSIRYEQDNTPVAPRFELNAPDLYIPVMALVTYVLVAGLVLGTQNRFTPEQLGGQASTAVGWLAIEVLLTLFALYVLNLPSQVNYLHMLSFSSYKFVGMIASLLSGLVLGTLGYYAVLAWCGAATGFFVARSLNSQMLTHPTSDVASVGQPPPSHGGMPVGGGGGMTGDSWNAPTTHQQGVGTKRRLYALLAIALAQPLLSWWLTRHLWLGSSAPP